MEREGKQGFSILVEGIRTGSAKVTAKLDDPAYKVTIVCASAETPSVSVDFECACRQFEAQLCCTHFCRT